MFFNKIIFNAFIVFSAVVLAKSKTDSKCRVYCYIKYNLENERVVEKYEYGIEDCLSKSENQRKKADLEVLETRQDLAKRTELTCKTIAHCKQSSSVEVDLECYRDLGSENHKNFKIISEDASFDLAFYKQKISAISVNEHICTNKTITTFHAETLAVKEKLKDCLRGKGWPRKA